MSIIKFLYEKSSILLAILSIAFLCLTIERTVLGSAVGKMAGCLLGAGVVLIIANFIV